ncbi:MAG TPA: apolipoprotein N-acyltransferase, partial [Cyanobacteria bacterium UBA8156]|nr:apolipoprotein N-acyltransferase [Cyanobacteria bacterium UBA8156]
AGGCGPGAGRGVVPLWWGGGGGGLLWGLGYHGTALFWLTGLHPMMWLGLSWPASLAIALGAWLVVTLWGAALTTLWGWFLARIPRDRLAIGIALFGSLEVLWGYGPLYWTALSLTQSPGNLWALQWGRLSGPQTLTTVLLLVGGCLYHLPTWPRSQRWYRLGAMGVLLLGLIGYGAGAANPAHSARSDGLPLQVGLIQPNIPNPIKFREAGLTAALDRHVQGYQTLSQQGVDFVLTTEGAFPFAYPRPSVWREPLDRAIATLGTPIWLGSFGETAQGLTNSLFLRQGRQTTARYDKVRLVPLGEYIPGQRWWGRWVQRLSPLSADTVPGDRRQRVDTPWGRVIFLLCYESAYPGRVWVQARHGGEFILSSANNAHYADTMPAQHHAQDVARAIEVDRWVARATNTGYSALIAPTGQTQWRSPLHQPAIHAGKIHRRQTATPYVRWGNGLSLFLNIWALYRLFGDRDRFPSSRPTP